ncbi:MAG: hypothetical protein JWN90_33 [Parcubacteria group bacterium]|nr:hypothetical protein [Parcubacteria group bacterium]
MNTYYESAVALRKQGLTYTEIGITIPVSKATLSLWLHDVPVPDSYADKIRILKLKAVNTGAQAKRKDRIDRLQIVQTEAREEFEVFKLDPLWLVGLTLYWAEGSKEKMWGKGVLITFTNMDEQTVIVFKNWCTQFLNTPHEDFAYSLYIHESRKSDTSQFINWWSKNLNISPENIIPYYKKTKITHVRRNDNDGYHGVFRLQVKRSVDKNRKIAAWITELTKSLKT